MSNDVVIVITVRDRLSYLKEIPVKKVHVRSELLQIKKKLQKLSIKSNKKRIFQLNNYKRKSLMSQNFRRSYSRDFEDFR